MALVRCPSCGRVADGKICFACGFEWPAASAAPAAVPEPKAPSQAFKVAAPSSFPTAARMQSQPPSEEVNLDVEIDTEEPAPPAYVPAQAFGAPFAPPPAAFAPAFPSAPAQAQQAGARVDPSAFPGPPAAAFPGPPAAFPGPPAAFPSTPAGGAPAFAGFGSPPPAFGQQVQSSPPAFAGFPPPAFPSPSGSWGAPPPASAPTPAFPSPSGNWGPPPAFPSLDRVPAPTAPAEPVYTTPAAPMPPPPRPAPVAPSPALNGLFDDIGSPARSADAPVADIDVDFSITEERPVAATLEELPPVGEHTSQGDNSVRDATQDAGDFFNFTLEPGSTVEPPAGPEPSPFDEGGRTDALPMNHSLGEEPSSDVGGLGNLGALDVGFTFQGDVPAMAPPPSVMGASQGFAELDSFDVDTLASADAPLTPMGGTPAPSMDDLSIEGLQIDDDVPAVSAGAASAGLAEDDFSLAGLEEEPLPPPLQPAPRTPPPPIPDDDFGLGNFGEAPAAPAPSNETDFSMADLGDAPAVPPPPDDDFGLGDFGEAPAALPVVVAQPAEDDFSIGEDLPPPPPPAATKGATPARATLSSRVGQLAEALEESGRISDAALLYEVQAVLSAAGR
ncbi:MAG: hypothetical protein Q8O67_28780 [Deltaproteobacteria bacterium]|nr:hypothetical protein [Deltaproteobacteria bacterium]